MRYALALGLGLAIVSTPTAWPQKKSEKTPELPDSVVKSANKGLVWLAKNQSKDGSWGKQYTIAVTSFACLAYLSSCDEPFDSGHSQTLTKGLKFLLSKQSEGKFPTQGHSWIHGQGFATLALSEAYGRSLFCKTKPDIDVKKIQEVVAQAVKVISQNQSTSGGWWYTPGAKSQHEGSTTVCAVQALVSASNYGIEIDNEALDRGFEYLKKCQNPDGGFDYSLGPGTTSMKEGTAGGVSTLGLMRKFDFTVMVKGYQFLNKYTPKGIANSFPFYGHFYGTMGMHLLWQEYKAAKSYRENTQKYISGVQKQLISWQAKDGSWPLRGWVQNRENKGFSTAWATLALYVPEARLSIYNREPPELPKGGK